MKKTFLFFAIVLIATLPALGGRLAAQPVNAEIPLLAAQVQLDRLAPGSETGEAVFAVDSAATVEVTITSSLAVTASIQAPGGEIVDASTVIALGGELAEFSGPRPGNPLLSSASVGFHQIYRFPSLGAGPYRVRFSAAPGLAEEVAVITQVVLDSPVGAALVATRPELFLGAAQVFSAAVFEGLSPVAGASAVVTVLPEGGAPITLPLLDDGQEADTAAGDGLYSAELVPSSPGRYSATVEIQGSTSAGIPFVRQAAALYEVLSPLAGLTGTVTDSGVDDDFDGRFDRIALQVGTDVVQAGTYRAFVRLETAGGRELLRSAEAALQAGLDDVEVDFEAAALRDLGEDGPYRIALVDLVFLGTERATPADRLENVGSTRTYRLSDFERPALALTGSTSDQGVDDDGDGLFDRLLVQVEVDVERTGSYSWSLKLADSDLREVDFATGSAFLASGLNRIGVTFDGEKIGSTGVDGPYLLRDLLLFGARDSLVAIDVGRTQVYRASQFPGSNRPPIADAGEDLAVECASPAATPVTLDGSGSTDPEGQPLLHLWTGPFPEGGGETDGVSPTVTLPLGLSTLALTVNDGQSTSAPDTVGVHVVARVQGLEAPLAGLVPEGQHPPLSPPFNAGRTLPLKLRLSCGDRELIGGEVSPPRIVALSRDGLTIDLPPDLDAGNANGGTPLFRPSEGQWLFNLSTRSLEPGTYSILLEMPDGRRLAAGFVLR